MSRLFSLCLYLLRPGRTNAMVGSKTALFETFMDSICVWPENGLFYVFLTLVPVGLKLPNRVRWPGGGIPYTFQNIPLCPGVVHESGEKTGEKSGEKSGEKTGEKSGEKTGEKSMLYYLCY